MPREFRLSARCSQGFSLVEVAIAIVVIGVVLVGLMGLLPSGTANFDKAMDLSVSAQIAGRLVADCQQAEFDALIDRANLPSDPVDGGYCPVGFTFRAPKVGSPSWRYYDAQGTEVVPSLPNCLGQEERRKVVYYANVRIMPRAVLPNPGESTSQLAQVTVQVIRNPNHLALPMSPGGAADLDCPERNLVQAGSLPIYTYPALIGRNQGR